MNFRHPGRLAAFMLLNLVIAIIVVIDNHVNLGMGISLLLGWLSMGITTFIFIQLGVIYDELMLKIANQR